MLAKHAPFDGSSLASAGSDSTVRIWDLERERCVGVLIAWPAGRGSVAGTGVTALQGNGDDAPLEWIRDGQGRALWMMDLKTYTATWPDTPLKAELREPLDGPAVSPKAHRGEKIESPSGAAPLRARSWRADMEEDSFTTRRGRRLMH